MQQTSARERMQLAYLAKSSEPLWGGHLQRGEPITSPEMQRWLDLGLIEQLGMQGYILTAKGHAEVKRKPWWLKDPVVKAAIHRRPIQRT